MPARLLVLLALSCALAGGCGGCDQETTAKPQPVALKPAAPVPDRLVAELVAGSPAKSIVALREAVGGPLLLMPRTLGGSVVSLFGLPLTVVEIIDEDLPLLGAVAEDDKGELLVTLAVHLKSNERFRSMLTLGAEATFSSHKEGDLQLLTPKPAARRATVPAHLSLLDHYLLIANRPEAARALGPYLSRTLGRTLGPQEASAALLSLRLTDHALHKALTSRVGALQDVVRALPLPPEVILLLDVDTIVASLTAELRGLRGAQLRVTLDDDGLRLEGEGEPSDAASAKRLAALPRQSPTALLDLPDDTVALLSWVETSEGRVKRAEDRAERWVAAAADLESDTKEQLRHALAGLAAGRGDRTALGLRCTGVGITGLGRGEVADAERLRGALGELVALRNAESIQKMLVAEGVKVSANKTRLELVPHDVWRLRLTPIEAKDAGADAEPIDFVYSVTSQTFLAAAGMETVPTMQRMVQPDSEHALSAKPEMKRAIERAPREAWTLAAFDPQSLHACLVGKPGGRFATPVVLAAGRDDKGLPVVYAEVARPLLRLIGKLATE